jgi:hypothetical protein
MPFFLSELQILDFILTLANMIKYAKHKKTLPIS